jgi:epoxide hydrolase-like predicted phosphatase
VAEARRGLLVDFGGVLTSDLFESFSAFCLAEGIEPNAVRDRFRSDADARALLIALEEGRMDEQEFEPRFATLLEVRTADGLIQRLMAGVEANFEMIDAVRAFRAAGVRTGLVSNSWGTRRYDRELLSELFDGVVISGEVGIRKPAPPIYALGAERIGLPPAECVFVDDLAFNLPPAAELGMATVHHRLASETIPALEGLLGVGVRR